MVYPVAALSRRMRCGSVLGMIGMLGCDRVFYYPNRVRYGSPKELNLSYESVQFSTSGGLTLSGYFFPAQPSEPGSANPVATRLESASQISKPTGFTESGSDMKVSPRGTILHLHGNAGNITGHFQHVAWLPAAGWNVLTFDYRGYGTSQGRVSRAGTIDDANAALDYLLHRTDIDTNRIVAFGQSLGAAVGIVLAAKRTEIRGLATDGAFDSYRKVVAWHIRRNPLLLVAAWWLPLGMKDDHDPIDSIQEISPRPLFIMHGTNDQIVDPDMATRLYQAAGEPKELWLVPDVDHYGALQDEPQQAHSRLLAFFEKCLSPSSPDRTESK
jgi:fermentation-respiration switch protein FrsA (DUF1100 family)